MKLSDKLIELRKSKGWSQEDFAEKLDVSRQAISRWENETAQPDVQNILRISKIFNVSADYLLNEDYENETYISTVSTTIEQSEPVVQKNKLPYLIAGICFTVLLACAIIIGVAIGKNTYEIKEQHTHDTLSTIKDNNIPSTCTSEGSYDEVVYCTECGEEILRTSKSVAKIAHTLSSSVKEREIAPTCTANGSYDEVFYCTECDAEILCISKTVEKLAHKLSQSIKEGEVTPTCTTNGSYYEVVYCSVCNDAVVRTKRSTPMLEHQFENKKCSACGENQPSEGLLFMSRGDGTCAVGVGDCTDENIVIPAYSPSGDKVVQIKAYAFLGLSKLKSVKIPHSVIAIGECAFEDCINLESVDMPSNLKRISYNAFKGCTNLKDITIPSGVYYIGEKAFADCVSMERIVIPASVTEIGKFAFKSFSRTEGTVIFEIYTGWKLYDDNGELYHIMNFENGVATPCKYISFIFAEYTWRRD